MSDQTKTNAELIEEISALRQRIRELEQAESERKRAEEALSENEERYRTLFEHSMDAILLTAPDGRGSITAANPAACRMFGYTEEELVQVGRAGVIDATDPRLIPALEERTRTGMFKGELMFIRKDGTKFLGELTSAIFQDSRGNISTSMIIRDITEHKQAEEALRRSEADLKEAQRVGRLGSWDWDATTDTITWSEEYYHIFGFDPTQRPPGYEEHLKTYTPESAARLDAAVKRNMQTSESYELDLELARTEEPCPWITARSETKRNAHGKIVGLRGTAQDITDRKQAEEALRDAHWRLESIIEGTHVGTWEWNVQTGETIFNGVWAQTIGYTLDELAPISIKTWETFVHPDDLKQSGELLERHFAGKLPYYDCECRMKHKDGHWVWVHNRGRVITRTGDGKPLMMFGTHTDITGRKRVGEELSRVSRALRMLSDTNQALLHITDEATLLNEVCRISVEVGGYRMAWVGFAEHDEIKTVHPVAHAGFDSGYIESADVTWADNERGRGPGGTAIRTGQPCVARNIPGDTAFAPWREKAIRRGYKSSIALPLISVGQTLGELAIYSVETDAFDAKEVEILKELAGDLAFGITALRTRAKRDLAEGSLRMANAYNRNLIEVSLDPLVTIGKDGKITDVNAATEAVTGFTRADLLGTDFSSYFTEPEKAREGYEQVFRSGFVRDYPLDIQHRDRTITSVLYNASIYKDDFGNVIGVFAAARDITMRKQAEEKIQASLLEKETMLKEIHHRVKNNLQVISSLLDLQSSYLQDEKAREALRESMARVRTMAMIHTQLYQSQDLARIDFGLFIRDLIGNIRQSYGTAAFPVEINVDADKIRLGIDTSIPCGLILNELVANALKHAFPEGSGGRIDISMKREGNHYILKVQDNGIGLPESTDLTNTQTLGLQLVNVLVRQLNGKIDIEVDGGAAFAITFPVMKD